MKAFFTKIHPVEDEILEEYLSHWSPHSTSKKTILTHPGKTETYIYYVKHGIQKSYYLNEDKEHIMFFAYSPSFSGVVESFLTQTPSKYYLETITDSEFMRLSYAKHQELIQKHRSLETLFRKITEQFLVGIIERHHQLMAFNAETRFTQFAKRSPHLFQLVPQKDIASYLRIDPTNFSKMMNSIKI
ncbi:Crp/Fnr family transcriptional regulator [Flagellimonas allohymeniacidonis]|uniref:Crp/Fnr family transcriptional regulator n=1 Tax=Flagellimonas allohymeniacidonis TaxID=2517819 RepID=A0A4Q8QJI9_9FLAO|nr:Crp/Fnr family transcriptional regulator [Allomuricauda hymeniacidonis]TAI49488.1 Crp/Fnr family transcriptional regulator [Allomuricauda hymeniacidonis]